MPSQKYQHLTKDFLETEYRSLKSFQAISKKHKIPRTTVERYCKKFHLITTPKKIYMANHSFFSKDTEESFYLAGFIAADGCIPTKKGIETNVLTIALAKKDENHLIKMKNIMEYNGVVYQVTNKLSKYNDKWNDVKKVRIDIYSKQMINDLKRFGIGPRKSLTYMMSEWMIYHPLRHHFVRGYVDGDGCFYLRKDKRKGGNIKISHGFNLTGTSQMLKQIQKMIMNESKTKIRINNNIGSLTYSGDKNVKIIANFLYNKDHICLQRKKDVINNLLTNKGQ